MNGKNLAKLAWETRYILFYRATVLRFWKCQRVGWIDWIRLWLLYGLYLFNFSNGVCIPDLEECWKLGVFTESIYNCKNQTVFIAGQHPYFVFFSTSANIPYCWLMFTFLNYCAATYMYMVSVKVYYHLDMLGHFQCLLNFIVPEKLASKNFGYLACDRWISYIYFRHLEFLPL